MQVPEIVSGRLDRPCGGKCGIDILARWQSLVEAGKLLRQGLNILRRHQSGLNAPIQEGIFRELAHQYRVFDSRLDPYLRTIRSVTDGYDLQVQFGSSAPVETHLLFAKVLASFQGGKIQESQRNLLFYLVL